jgi:hypothetical protein
MVFTALALAGVLGVLMLTGTVSPTANRFAVDITPTIRSIETGGLATVAVTVTGHGGFHGSLDLDTTMLPAGVTAEFTQTSIAISRAHRSVTVALTLRAASSAQVGASTIGVNARHERSVQTGNLLFQIKPSSTAGAPLVSPSAVRSASGIVFDISGSPVGSLEPGARLPVNLSIGNRNRQRLSVGNLEVAITSTDKPGCARTNFSISQYQGGYPLRIPAGQRRSLAQLGVPIGQWPLLIMQDGATEQDACKNVTVNLGYLGFGSGS